MKSDEGFTVVDEYVHHANAAVAILLEHAAVDQRGIFLAGPASVALSPPGWQPRTRRSRG